MKVYKLGNPYSSRYAEPWTDSKYWEWSECPVCKRQIMGKKKTEGFVIEWHRSSRIGDFSWVPGGEIIVSQRVKAIFEEHNVTGCKYGPVEMIDPEDPEDPIVVKLPYEGPPLYELIITGSGGNAAEESGIKIEEKCDHCGSASYLPFDRRIDVLIIDPANWDGSDVFKIIEMGNCTFITEKVKSLIEAHKFTNVECIPVKMKQK
jgi:hypothetical protein